VLLELRKKQQKQEAERDRLNEELKVSKLKRLTALVPYYETITNAKSDIHKLEFTMSINTLLSAIFWHFNKEIKR
jgi:hypothetical protein